MQEQSRSEAHDPNFRYLKRFGELLVESESKKEFKHRLNGFLLGMQTNGVLTPSKSKQIEVMKQFKTMF